MMWEVGIFVDLVAGLGGLCESAEVCVRVEKMRDVLGVYCGIYVPTPGRDVYEIRLCWIIASPPAP